MKGSAVRIRASALGQDEVEPTFGLLAETRVVLLAGIAEYGYCVPDRPASGSGPGGLVGRECLAEGVSCFGGMELPRNHHIAGRVTDTHARPVDHRADAPFANEPVARIKIAVVPNGRAIPYGCHQCSL